MPTFEELDGQVSDRLTGSGQEGEGSQGSSSFDFRTATQAMNFRNMWSGGDFDRHRYNYERVTLRPSLVLGEQTREERTTNMNIAIKLPELTEQEKSELLTFYKKVLQDGYAQWPLRDGQAALWIDGKVRRIQSYSNWLLARDVLYIGHSSDMGQDDVSDPILRLAIVTALMAMTGHTGNPTLMGLLERRLSVILTGNYQTVFAPLGQRPDGSPVDQIAWSITNGLAARLGDEWVRPFTGEPVEVGAGWVVLEVPKQQAVAVEGETEVSQDSQTAVRTLREFAEARDYVSKTLSDGRYALGFAVEERAREVLADAVSFGCVGLVVDWDVFWSVTTPSTPPPAPETDLSDPF